MGSAVELRTDYSDTILRRRLLAWQTLIADLVTITYRIPEMGNERAK